MDIHPTAVIDPDARLASGVVVGPYVVIESGVTIGPRTTIGAHAIIHRFVRMGEDNRVHPNAIIGGLPQDISFTGKETWVEIANHNVFREGVTVNRSTTPDAPTKIGSDCLLMANVHVAHDCCLGDRVILANNTALGGHVKIEDLAFIGGGVVVHQFCRIGSLAMVAGFIAVRQDVLPYCMVAGTPVRHYRLNTIGLRRNGITGERYHALETAFRALRDGRNPGPGAAFPEVEHLRRWRAQPSRRGVYRFFRPESKTVEAELLTF